MLDPSDGVTTDENSVVISGVGPPNATITHDVPMWFDEHTVADPNGRWSFIEPLNVGENTFLFRVADDTSTQVTLTVIRT